MEELKNRKIWIRWRMTESSGKKTKKPISASGTVTGTNDRYAHTWVTYSHSEADCSLCSVIAFRTGNNPELIDAVFRRSALYRDKWERADYREATIEAAVAACRGVFHKSVMPRPEYIVFNPKTGSLKINCPKLAKHIRGNLKYIFVRDNARSGVIKYVYENGCYRLYSDDMIKGIRCSESMLRFQSLCPLPFPAQSLWCSVTSRNIGCLNISRLQSNV